MRGNVINGIDISKYYALCKNLAYKYSRTKYKGIFEAEDILQEAYAGLVKAARHFDKEKKNEFITYAYSCILNEIITMVRDKEKFYRDQSGSTDKTKLRKNNVSLYTEIKELGKPIQLIETLRDSKDLEEEAEIRLEVNRALNKLDSKEKDIITDYYFKDIGQKEIGQKYGVSQVQMSRIIKKSLAKMRG